MLSVFSTAIFPSRAARQSRRVPVPVPVFPSPRGQAGERSGTAAPPSCSSRSRAAWRSSGPPRVPWIRLFADPERGNGKGVTMPGTPLHSLFRARDPLNSLFSVAFRELFVLPFPITPFGASESSEDRKRCWQKRRWRI